MKNGIKAIESFAFSHCNSLTKILISISVTTLKENAIYSCENIIIYCEATAKPDTWHENCNGELPVYWYSESEPTTEGNYWRYDDNNEIVIW